MASTLGVLNHIVYKSYYIDYENDLYYLKTRYYNPNWGRFISNDKIEYLDPSVASGLNLYCYCLNDPVMNSDPEGTIIIPRFIRIIDLLMKITNAEIEYLLKNEKYSAKTVPNNEELIVPNSFLFNNPIAQFTYSNYLYENVIDDNGDKYFTGGVYEIMGEWQAHNLAFWAPIEIAFHGILTGNVLSIAAGTILAIITHPHANHLNIGKSIDADKVGIIRLFSKIFKCIDEALFK